MKPWPNTVEKKRAVLCEVNAFIARIMDKKKETCSSSGCTRFNSRAIAEVCEQFYFRRRGEHFEEDVLQFSDDVFSSLRLKTIYY